ASPAQPRPSARRAVSAADPGGDHLDLVGNPADAAQPRYVVEGGVTLVLMPDLSLQSEPPVFHFPIDPVVRHIGVPDQHLQSYATELVIVEPVLQVDGELVDDIADARNRLGDLDRRAALAEATDATSERHGALPLGHRHLIGMRDPRITVELGPNCITARPP